MKSFIDASADGIDSKSLLNAVKALEILGADKELAVRDMNVSFKLDRGGCLETHFLITTSENKEVRAFFQSGNGYKPSGEQMAHLVLDKKEVSAPA